MDSSFNSTCRSEDMDAAQRNGLKKRISELELINEQQKCEIDELRKYLSGLVKTQEEQRAQIEVLRKELNNYITSEVEKLDESTEHKFSLQLAENKRLQSQIQVQRKSYEEMKDNFDMISKRLGCVEQELEP